jgi:flavin-binding protein dodecin
MDKVENNIVRERLSESLPSAAMAEQIQRALDMMKRVRAVNAEQAEQALEESASNKYVLPEPVVFHVGAAS